MAPYPTTITAIATLFLTQICVQGKANGLPHDNVASVEESSNRFLEQARIVGGSRPSVDEYPWFARATLQGSRWGGCGGTLVTPEYVLTAAHCINDNFRAYGGYEIGAYCSQTDNCGQNEEVFDVGQITVHPDYNRTELMDNDFALVRLSGISTITPVKMDGDGESLSNGYSAGKLVSAIGFGTLSSGGAASPDLLDVEVKYQTNAQCNQDYNPRGLKITANMMCAADNGKDACQGDSGGPLYDKEKDTLVGVVSFGIGCADPNYSGIYARILNQKIWIQETICANHKQPKPAFCGPQSPTAAPTSCADMAVVVTVDSDDWPDEISWKITGKTTISSPRYHDKNSNYVHEYCLDATKCYTFTILDSYGDGILSSGGYSVEVDGEAVNGLGDAFKKTDSGLFGTCERDDSCNDSTLIFLVNRKPRDCDWVKFNTKVRCNKTGIKSMCPDTCESLCETDTPRRFQLRNGKFKSCKWVGNVEEKIADRCAKDGVGEICHDTCSGNVRSNGLCIDSALTFLVNRQPRDCDWVKSNTIVRCNKTGIKSLCPDTCKSFDFCETDTSRRFQLRNGKFKSCKWVGNVVEKITNRCAKDGVEEICHDTCSRRVR